MRPEFPSHWCADNGQSNKFRDIFYELGLANSKENSKSATRELAFAPIHKKRFEDPGFFLLECIVNIKIAHVGQKKRQVIRKNKHGLIV